MQQASVAITINGLEGSAKLGACGIELRGPWASHTGYRSDAAGVSSECGAADLYAAAEARYEEQKVYAFAVGDEHRDNGWKTLGQSHDGSIEIRLPQWHQGIVSKVLESYGMQFTCKFNYRWSFPAGSGVDMATARTVFAPILSPGTRFADEHELAKKIDSAACQAGYSLRTPLQHGGAQCALF